MNLYIIIPLLLLVIFLLWLSIGLYNIAKSYKELAESYKKAYYEEARISTYALDLLEEVAKELAKRENIIHKYKKWLELVDVHELSSAHKRFSELTK